MKNTPEVGMRVHVCSEDKTKDLGLGTIEKVKPLHIMGAGFNISTTFPSSILLDSGEAIDGLHCWWISVEDEEKNLKQKRINETNNIEKIEEAIEAKMAEIERYKNIKRPNSYYMLAQLLERYRDMCIDCGRGCVDGHILLRRTRKKHDKDTISIKINR